MRRIAIWFIGTVLLTGVAYGSPETPSPPVRNENPIYIKSDQLLTDTNNRTATFIGKVTARQADVVIYSDKMVVYSAAEGGSVERVVCTGNVRIVQKDRTGTAGVATYENALGKIVLTVNPKVIQGEDVVTGSEITYYLGDKKSVVTGAPGVRVEAVIHPKGKSDAAPGH